MIRSVAERQKIFQQKAQKIKNKNLWEKRGCQVVISARNASDWLPIILNSVENAMKNLDWVMHFADDESDDDTYKIVNFFSQHSSAKEFNLFKFKKAQTVAGAKNRIIEKTLGYKEDYPAVFLADADDFFTQERALVLPEIARELNEGFLVGSWYHCKNGEKNLRKATDSIKTGLYGPWATLMHVDMIPDDGQLFYEGMDAHEDMFLWDEFKSSGIKMVPVDSVIACYYNVRNGTVSRPWDVDRQKKELAKYKNLKEELLV
jgi:glycosyltransferase involved in cell wall biosynthesis